jgi:Ca2+-dependent lipid-binding protein
MSEQQQQQITGHRLEVTVEAARGLKATNFFSSTESDAFCELHVVDRIVKKTEVQFKSTSPTWNEKLILYVAFVFVLIGIAFVC